MIRGRSVPLRVATIDDDPAIRSLLRMLFDRHGGATVVAESDGHPDGLASLAAAQPDVALLDHRLGGEAGTELIATILRSCPRTMVAMLTACDPHVVEDEAFRAGAFAFYSKRRLGPDLLIQMMLDHALFRRALDGRSVVAPSVRGQGAAV